jgi:ferredoxin
MAITIDRAACIGTGNCTFYAPRTFDLDEDDKSILIDPLGDDEAARRMAVENCPASALSFTPDPPED